MSEPINTSLIKEWAEKTLKNLPGIGGGENNNIFKKIPWYWYVVAFLIIVVLIYFIYKKYSTTSTPTDTTDINSITSKTPLVGDKLTKSLTSRYYYSKGGTGNTGYYSSLDVIIKPFNNLIMGISKDELNQNTILKIAAYNIYGTIGEGTIMSNWYNYCNLNKISINTKIESLHHNNNDKTYIGCDVSGNYLTGISPINMISIKTASAGYVPGSTGNYLTIKDVVSNGVLIYCLDKNGFIYRALAQDENYGVDNLGYKDLVDFLCMYIAYKKLSQNFTSNDLNGESIWNRLLETMKGTYSYEGIVNDIEFINLKKDGTLLTNDLGEWLMLDIIDKTPKMLIVTLVDASTSSTLIDYISVTVRNEYNQPTDKIIGFFDITGIDIYNTKKIKYAKFYTGEESINRQVIDGIYWTNNLLYGIAKTDISNQAEFGCMIDKSGNNLGKITSISNYGSGYLLCNMDQGNLYTLDLAALKIGKPGDSSFWDVSTNFKLKYDSSGNKKFKKVILSGEQRLVIGCSSDGIYLTNNDSDWSDWGEKVQDNAGVTNILELELYIANL